MKKPIPDLSLPELEIPRGVYEGSWIPQRPRNRNDELKIIETGLDIPLGLPKGWSNPWPDLPSPDIKFPWVDPGKFSLNGFPCPCDSSNYLGYYVPWHYVALSHKNDRNRSLSTPVDLEAYNMGLPECKRFGIHICCETIERYIESFDVSNFKINEVDLYRHYCTYLILMYVISHEWGHYRSETLSFQLRSIVSSLSGGGNNTMMPSYLAYMFDGNLNFQSFFEEVFAEWASLKFGIFNYHLVKPYFVSQLSNRLVIEQTLRIMLSEVMIRSSRPRPYRDISLWVNFNGLNSQKVLEKLIENEKTQNRLVNDNTRIAGIQSFKRGKMIDLLMHNKMQYSTGRNFSGIIESNPRYYPVRPNSAYYHISDDDCMNITKPGEKSSHHVILGERSIQQRGFNRPNGFINQILSDLRSNSTVDTILPIPTYPRILPLDSIYFHG